MGADEAKRLELRSVAQAFSFLALVTMPISGAADNLDDFTTDGCSAFPDGTPAHKTLWLRCCREHDFSYWLGGSAEQRRLADIELRDCVADVGQEEMANLMLAGVRVGGSPWWPTRFRWAYGWPYLRGYQQISNEEQPMVDAKVAAARRLIEKSSLVTPR